MLHHREGATQAHTAREHVDSSARSNWTLRRTLVEVCRGEDSLKLPKDRGVHFRSHATDAALTESMLSNTSSLMKVCGEQCR